MQPPFPRSIHFSPWHDSFGGANRSVLTLTAEMARRSLGSLFFIHDGDVPAEARRLGIPVYTAFGHEPSPKSLATRAPRIIGAFRKAVREQEATIFHCHSAFGMPVARVLALAAGTPLVCHQRDNFQADHRHRYLHDATWIVAISNWVHSTLPVALQRKATVIHNALPPAVDRPGPPDGVGTGGVVRIGMAGRCIREKGFDTFLDAAALLEAEPVEFEIWGIDRDPAPESHGAEIHARLRSLPTLFRRRINVQPFRNDVDQFFQRCDVVVIPSRFAEPFGRMALEAMNHGKAVVVSGHGGLIEIVEDGVTGRSFRPGDSGELATVLRDLIHDADGRESLALRGRRHVESAFSAADHCDAVLRLYASLPEEGLVHRLRRFF